MPESTPHGSKDFHFTGKSVGASPRTADPVVLAEASSTKRSERFRRRLTEYRWELVVSAGIVAFVLGFFGYSDWLNSLHRHDPVNIPAPEFGDKLFDSAALFVLGADQGTGMPVILEIARLLAPVAIGSAAWIALYALSRDRFQRVEIMRMQGHVVVCGLGQVGTEFLRHLWKGGVRAVVIESDPANPGIELCRSLKTPVIVGDAQREQTLRSAGVERAARLFAVGPSDAVNAEIVAVAQGLAIGEPRRTRRASMPAAAAAQAPTGRRPRWKAPSSRRSWRRLWRAPAPWSAPVHCLARINDPELCALLRIQEANLTSDSRSSALEFFNLDDISARAWLKHPPIPRGGRPHILVSRLDGLGTSLVMQAAAAWYADCTDDTRLWVTVVDDHAEERIGALCDQYPGIKAACRFFYCSTSVPDVRGLAARLKEAGAPQLNRVYVTADTDEQALETALMLHHHFDAKVPLVVEMWQTSGVGRLIGATDTRQRTNIEMFPSLESACTRELILGETFRYYEAIAVAIHEYWREQQLPGKEPAVTWQDLDESRKESSRAQARDIPVKLRSIGYDVAPVGDSKESTFTLTKDEIERLARDEHKRWVRERIEDGWQQADDIKDKDVVNKRTPFLVPFQKLPSKIADFDRNAVRAIPAVLKLTDQQVVPAKTTELDASPPARRWRRCFAKANGSPFGVSR